MAVLIRVARVVLLLLLACLVVSLIIGLFRPETGLVEKVTLVALIAACFGLGAGLTTAAARLQRRLAPR